MIPSYEGKSIISCCKVSSSITVKSRRGYPRCALLGIDSSSFWGENTTVLGWYEDEVPLKKEIQEIQEALQLGEPSYQLKYAVKVQWHWGQVKIVKDE